MRTTALLALLVSSVACVSGPRPTPLAIKDPAALPKLECGRKSSKPVEVSIETLAGNHLAISILYPSLHEQFRYLIEEVRTLKSGQKALAGHKLSNADGNLASLDPKGSFLFFSGTPPRSDNLNATYQFNDQTTQVHLDLESGETAPSGPRAMSVFLRCENLDAFIAALSAE